MKRQLSIAKLNNEEFDLCIIGSGASGAGCALDAALRGYKVALIDRDDFSGQTSSRSTKLIHGGVRYLEQAFKKLDFGQLKQVKHGLEERHIVLKNAPHLARPLPLLTPVNSWIEGLYFTIGLKLYDQFAVNDTLPKSKWLKKNEVLAKMPTLNRKQLHSAVLYYDGQLDDARYCLSLVQSAGTEGAVVANYVSVTGFELGSKSEIIAVNAIDLVKEQPIKIKAKKVINCTGPFADHIRSMANPQLLSRMRPSKGVHLVLPKKVLDSEYAMLIPKTSDGRVVFAIPFEGGTMLGTTDTAYSELGVEPGLNVSEKKYLAETLNPYLEQKIDLKEIQSGFGGLRPLLSADPSKSTKNLVRDHEVEVDALSGLVSLLGGKWTTYRLMAMDTIDEIDEQFGNQVPCTTADYVIYGGENFNIHNWKEIQLEFGLSENVSRHLMQKYGCYAKTVAGLTLENTKLEQLIHPDFPYILAEVVYGVRFEMVIKIRDFLARRTRMEITNWSATLASIVSVANILAEELDWSWERRKLEIECYTKEIEGFMEKAGVVQ